MTWQRRSTEKEGHSETGLMAYASGMLSHGEKIHLPIRKAILAFDWAF